MGFQLAIVLAVAYIVSAFNLPDYNLITSNFKIASESNFKFVQS